MSAITADVVVINGRIITMDDSSSTAEAFTVADGQFVSVGTTAEALESAGPDTVVVDAGGRSVVPGLIDAHAHLELLAYSWEIAVDCRSPEMASIDDIVDRLRARADERPAGAWIFGQGNHFQDSMLAERRYPDRDDLDRASLEHPIVYRASYHINVFNSKALELLAVTKETPDAAGGRIERDPKTGELTGRTIDMYNALGGPEAPLKDLIAAMVRTQQRYLQVGITAVGDIPLLPQGLAALLELERSSELLLRVTAYPKLPSVVSVEEIVDGSLRRPFDGIDEQRLKLGGIKLFLDGGLTASAAALYEPYEGSDDYRGELGFTATELAELCRAIAEAGHQVAIHAIGDLALDMALDALAALPPGEETAGAPHRIEHAGNLFMTAERIARFRDSRILPVPQPVFIYTTAPGYKRLLGPERSRNLMPFRTLLEAGLRLPGNSDAVGIIARQHDPFFGMWAAVARTAQDGSKVDPQEAVTAEQALRMYTRDAAHALGSEARLGSIEPGKCADFAILDADPLTADPEAIANIGVDETWIGGVKLFAREPSYA